MSAGSLERLLLADPVRGRLAPASGDGAPTWLRHGDWRLLARLGGTSLPAAAEPLVRFKTDTGEAVAAWDAGAGVLHLPFDPNEALDNYVSEAWRVAETSRHLSSRQLDLFYRVKRLIPRGAQLAARRALIRWQGLPSFPAWPLDLSVVRLLHFYALCLLKSSAGDELRFRWFWPNGHSAAVILTHDVESAEGLRLALDLADLEEERGLRSSFNVVADWYPIDRGALDELRSRGFEIGVHGVHHDRSMFASRESFEAQQPAVVAAARDFGAVGFRSPATHRVFDWLGDLPTDYDASVPHSDPFEPQPGGCCSLWPFFIGRLVELPYTLPQDHTVLTLLRRDSAALWRQQLDDIAGNHGMAQALTHPDRGYLADSEKRAVYADFLNHVAGSEGLWKPLPREVAEWWRKRDAGEAGAESRYGTIRQGEGFFGIELQPPEAEATVAEARTS